MPFEVGSYYHQKDTFGLDIGTHSLKIVQLKKRGRGTNLVGYGSAEIPDGVIVEGIISDPDMIANSIKEILKSQPKINATRVTASLPESKIFTRQMELPELERKQAEEAIYWETEQYVPVPIADLYIDWQVIRKETVKPPVPIEETGRKRQKKQKTEVNNHILLVAAPKSIVDSYLQVFRLLDIEPLALEMSLAAITRALVTPQMTGKINMIVNIGAADTDVAIVKERTLHLTGSTPVGGDSMTAAIGSRLKIEAREADELKKKFGISEWGLQAKVLEGLSPILDQITSEIERVVKFFEERDNDAKTSKIENILLAGGAANTPGLPEYLGNKLGIPTAVGNPWANIGVYPLKPVPKVEVPLYTTAIGLAMRGLEE